MSVRYYELRHVVLFPLQFHRERWVQREIGVCSFIPCMYSIITTLLYALPANCKLRRKKRGLPRIATLQIRVLITFKLQEMCMVNKVLVKYNSLSAHVALSHHDLVSSPAHGGFPSYDRRSPQSPGRHKKG
jgi:hypothetical protein